MLTEPDPELAVLGEHIRQRRAVLGISMEALAGAAGIGRSTVHRIEHGLIVPRPRNMGRIVAALGWDAAQAEELLPELEPGWKADALHFLAATEAAGSVQEYARGNVPRYATPRPRPPAREPDLVALAGDGTRLSIIADGEATEDALSVITEALKRKGFQVLRPA